MKIGVLKLGARITWDLDASVTSGEAISICKALQRGGAEVHVFTKILKKDTLHPSLVWHNIADVALLDVVDTDMIDVLVVINGNVNFFGGAEDREQILNYEIMNSFNGPVVYIMCDPELPLTQIWESIAKKPWGNQYREDRIFIKKPIHLLSQPFDLEAVRTNWPKKGAPLGQIVHFPMERFPYLNEWLQPSKTPAVDLLYGGTPRGGRRIPNLYKWYWNLPKDISVEIFGSIDVDDFLKHPKIGMKPLFLKDARPPEFTGKVKYGDVLAKMNGALAHMVTGDPSYEVLDLIPQRVAECIAAGNIVFVDANIDKSRRIYPAGTMAHDFLYVSTQDELVDRLRIVKADPGIRADLIEAQCIAVDFNADEFCKSLVTFLRSFS